MAYSEVGDLLIGDIPLPARIGDGSKFVDMAADEIDSQVGHIYTTPIVIPDEPQYRPARLLLKKINNLIASGRIILDMAAGGEDNDLHAYGRSMLNEGLSLLASIVTGRIVLIGAPLLPGTEDVDTGPLIVNEDPESLVEAFYQQFSHGESRSLNPPRPYKDRVV